MQTVGWCNCSNYYLYLDRQVHNMSQKPGDQVIRKQHELIKIQKNKRVENTRRVNKSFGKFRNMHTNSLNVLMVPSTFKKHTRPKSLLIKIFFTWKIFEKLYLLKTLLVFELERTGISFQYPFLWGMFSFVWVILTQLKMIRQLTAEE